MAASVAGGSDLVGRAVLVHRGARGAGASGVHLAGFGIHLACARGAGVVAGGPRLSDGVLLALVVARDRHAITAASARHRNVSVTGAAASASDGGAVGLVLSAVVWCVVAGACGADVFEPGRRRCMSFAVVYALVRRLAMS